MRGRNGSGVLAPRHGIYRMLLVLYVVSTAIEVAAVSEEPGVSSGPGADVGVPDRQLISLATQCGPFMAWSSNDVHILWLFHSKTPHYHFSPPGTTETLEVRGMLVKPGVLSDETIGVERGTLEGHALLNRYADWEIQYLKKFHGLSELPSSLDVERTVGEKHPIQIQVRTLRYPAPVDVYGFPVRKWLIAAAAIDREIVGLGAAVRDEDDPVAMSDYLVRVLSGITRFQSRKALAKDIRRLQSAALTANDCRDFLGKYQAGGKAGGY